MTISALLAPSDDELLAITGMDVPDEVELDEELDDDPSVVSNIDLA